MHSPLTSEKYSCSKFVQASSLSGFTRLEHVEMRIPIIYSEDMELYTLFGQRATAGTNGNNGMKGGKGGMNGKLVLHSLSEPVKSLTENIKGKNGASGKGGRAGKGGRHGSNKTFSCRHFTAAMLFWKVNIKHLYTTTTGFAENGYKGVDDFYEIDGYNDEVELEAYAKIVTAYKTIIFKAPANSWSRHESISFLKMLSSNKTILDLYRLEDFVNEFETMNETYKISTANPDWPIFYEILLNSLTSWRNTSMIDIDNGKSLNLISKIQEQLTMMQKERDELLATVTTETTSVTLLEDTTMEEQLQSFTEMDSLVYVTEADLNTDTEASSSTVVDSMIEDITEMDTKTNTDEDISVDSDFPTVASISYDEYDWVNEMHSYQKRKKRHVEPVSVPETVHNSYRSSATKPLSFISSTFNWIQTKTKNLFMVEKPTITSNAGIAQLSHHNIATNHEKTFKESGSVKDGLHFSVANFNPTILLLDLLVRKFTKTKANHCATTDTPHVWLEAQAIALTITEECEQLFITKGCHSAENSFDVMELQKHIMAKVLKDGPGQVSEIRNAAIDFVKAYRV
jgi:hypothetical protein